MPGRVDGKVCIVTGSTSGIGEAIAAQLADEGGSVVVCGRRSELGRQVVERLVGAGGRAVFQATDVTSPADCQQLVAAALAAYGGLDAIVHNAGLSTRGSVTDMDLGAWERVFATNVTAPFLINKHAIPHLRARGGGSIVHIGSAHTSLPKRNLAAYCASRGALLMLTKQMAVEYLDDRIRVNLVNPGWVDTPGERELLQRLGGAPDVMDRAAESNPFGRLLSPVDIAYVVTYLVSDESALVTGSSFDIHHEHPRCL